MPHWTESFPGPGCGGVASGHSPLLEVGTPPPVVSSGPVVLSGKMLMPLLAREATGKTAAGGAAGVTFGEFTGETAKETSETGGRSAEVGETAGETSGEISRQAAGETVREIAGEAVGGTAG